MQVEKELGSIRKEVMMKKYWLWVLLVFLLTGCSSQSSYTVTKPVGEVKLPEVLGMSYDTFNGTKFGDFYPVAEGESVEFQVTVETRGGSLSIYLRPEENKETIVYKAENIQTSEFSFTIDKPGMYGLYLEGKDHQGGYSIKNIRTMKP